MRILHLFTLLVLSASVFAQDIDSDYINGSSVTRGNDCEAQKLVSYAPVSGGIPLAYGHVPATDLICDQDVCFNDVSYGEEIPSTQMICNKKECGEDLNLGDFIPGTGELCRQSKCLGKKKGEILNVYEADTYYKHMHAKTRCQWSLADLEPAQNFESSHLWSNKPIESFKNVELRDDNAFSIKDFDSVDHISDGWARLGNYRITINKTNRWGVPRQYTVFLSKSVHNFLLRKALLRKLGYKVPPVKRVGKLNINFPTKELKDKFLEQISVKNAGSFDRWVLSSTKKSVLVQDVIIMEDQEFNYNLSKGYLSEDVFQGKRIFDSLIIPFALTNAPESINQFEWVVGRRFSDNVLLKFDQSQLYNCSKDDAVWMVRRIMKLTEGDWLDIVNATDLPPSVKVLLLEKLKSRRNHLGSLFGVQNMNLSVDTQINNHDDLHDGEITREFYDGYARRFVIPDPETPFSQSEMISFVRAKGRSIGIDLLVNALNSASFMSTDIDSKVRKFQEDLAESIKTSGEAATSKLPVKGFAFPTIGGSLILNREIVAGSYLGTDNLIQLVDTVGASMRIGMNGGLTGIYSQTGKKVADKSGNLIRQFVPVNVRAGANVFLNRTYSHVKPITSVKKAIKYPFKNILVPLLKRRYGKTIDTLMNGFYKDLSPEGKIQRNKNVYNSIVTTLENMKFALRKKKNRDFDELIQDIDDTYAVLQADQEKWAQSTDATQLDFIISFSAAVNALVGNTLDSIIAHAADKNICFVMNEDTNECQEVSKENLTTELISNKISSMTNYLEAMESLDMQTKTHVLRLENKEEQTEIEDVMSKINENLEVGESLIISDSLGGSLSAGASMSLYSVIKLKLDVSASKNLMGRLHILRVSEDEIHVYKDFGNINAINISAGVNAFVPIVKISFKVNNGKGRIKFHKVPIGAVLRDKTINAKRVDYLRAMRKTLLTGTTKALAQIESPYVIEHKFKENKSKIGVIVFRWNWLRQSDYVTVRSPEGFEKTLYYGTRAYTQGRDLENYAGDLVSLLFSKIFDTETSLNGFSAGNPGYTFFGKAKNKIVTMEGEADGKGNVAKPFLTLSRIWNGWKLKKDKALDILEDIRNRYQFNFIEKRVLAQTDELFLYNINVKFHFYSAAVKSMLEMKKDQVKKIFTHYQQSRKNKNDPEETIEIKLTKKKSWNIKIGSYNRFLRMRSKYQKFANKNNMKKASKYLMKMIEVVEKNLRMAGIGLISGGGNNVFASAQIEGFRNEDVNGDKTILSNTFGRVGREGVDGPLEKMRKFLGMTRGEFMMSWLMGRVI